MEKIAVCVVTFNQEKYIAQTLDSILQQIVSIPVKIFIGEDNSCDNTKNICLKYKKEFPDKFELIIQPANQGLVKNTISVLNVVREERYTYIAMLDGDDYWTDNFKLQKEYDFLKQNPEYGMVHTNISLLYGNDHIKNTCKYVPEGNVFHCIDKFSIANSTVLFHTNLLELVKLEDFITQSFFSLDYPMYVIFSRHTKIGFIPDFTAVWRRGHASVSNQGHIEEAIGYIENDINMWSYLDSLFPDRFGYNAKNANHYRNYCTFNIAFRFNDYELAKATLRNMSFPLKRGFLLSLKIFSVKSKFLFYSFCFLKKIRRK